MKDLFYMNYEGLEKAQVQMTWCLTNEGEDLI